MSTWRVIHGDCLEVLKSIPAGSVDAVVTDPPYGMNYTSSMDGRFGDCAIAGDESTALRDAVVSWVIEAQRACLCFGHWGQSKPTGTRQVLVWEKGPHVGMGALDIPWKPNTEEIYVIGSGFVGHRGTSVLQFNAVSPNFQAVDERREHPTQKPLSLMRELLSKCPAGTILDPFCGSGTTGVACMQTGRNFIGIEISEEYCEIARRRISEAATTLWTPQSEPAPHPILFPTQAASRCEGGGSSRKAVRGGKRSPSNPSNDAPNCNACRSDAPLRSDPND